MLVSTFSMAYRAEHTQSEAASWRLVEVSSLCYRQENMRDMEMLTTTWTLKLKQQQQQQKPHQDLEENHEELITGHEVTVQDAQVEPAAQAAKHLDQHLLIIPRLLHTHGLKGKEQQCDPGPPQPQTPGALQKLSLSCGE